MNSQPDAPEVNSLSSSGKHSKATITKRVHEPFDFRRPDRIAKSQLRAIYVLHEAFARSLASSLSAYLRSYMAVNLSGVEQRSYHEFLEGLPNPSCIVSLSLQPNDGNWLIEISPGLIFPILEIILGGKGTDITETPSREITEIEQHLLDTLFRIILNDLKEAWKAVAPIEFNIDAIATAPQSVQTLSPSEAVVVISFEVKMGEHNGSLNLAMPAINIKMIGQRFEHQWSTRKAVSSEADRSRMLGFIGNAEVLLDAQLRGPRVGMEDLLNLQVGDCLQFDYPAGLGVDCLVNGVPKFHGQIVESNSRRAFLVEKLPAAAAHRAPKETES